MRFTSPGKSSSRKRHWPNANLQTTGVVAASKGKPLEIPVRLSLLLAASLAAVQPAIGQSISVDRLRSVVETIAADSMGGRPTPSVELDRAAQFIASQFQRAGLKPLGSDNSFIQRYPVVESVLGDSARIEIGPTTWKFGGDFFYAAGGGSPPHGTIVAPVVFVSGKAVPGAQALSQAAGKIVVFLSPLTQRGGPQDMRSAFTLGGAGARVVIIAGGRPDTIWKLLSPDRDEHKPAVEAAWKRFPTTFENSAQRFRSVLELWGGRWERFVGAASFDTSALARTDSVLRIIEPGIQSRLVFARNIERVSLAPNVLGYIEGADPLLRHEYIVVTAHFDGLGREKGRPPGPASILNGADDNASGVAAMIAVADALGRTSPGRSVIFAAVSGEELGLWGSDFFAMNPPVPIAHVVANVNMDMIGRARADTVFMTGGAHPWLGAIARSAMTRSPGLVIQDEAALERRFPGERADDRSDHASFRKRGVPSLSFFTGWHDDYHSTTDDAATLDYAALGRIAELVRNIVASAAADPRR